MPLDSSNDKLDSQWGNKAYDFGVSELEKYDNDSKYQIRPSIKIVINVKAEQIIDPAKSSDTNYPMGKLILYDLSTNAKCEQLSDSDTCIRTHVIDTNNKKSDTTVTLLPDLFGDYSTGTYANYDDLLASTISDWNVTTRPLQIEDILNVVSKDVINSLIIRENLSDSIMGYMNSEERINTVIDNTILYNGYYTFLNASHEYLVTNKCYWLNKPYNKTKAFALMKYSEEKSRIYG